MVGHAPTTNPTFIFLIHCFINVNEPDEGYFRFLMLESNNMKSHFGLGKNIVYETFFSSCARKSGENLEL